MPGPVRPVSPLWREPGLGGKIPPVRPRLRHLLRPVPGRPASGGTHKSPFAPRRRLRWDRLPLRKLLPAHPRDLGLPAGSQKGQLHGDPLVRVGHCRCGLHLCAGGKPALRCGQGLRAAGPIPVRLAGLQSGAVFLQAGAQSARGRVPLRPRGRDRAHGGASARPWKSSGPCP